MKKETGNLSIHSENIFPIIKKWLYSDHDIFIRELVSNACDAITKLKSLQGMGEADIPAGEAYQVDVVLDSENKTLTFTDNGIGMTAEEIKKYINQIAFSGAEDFIKMYKDKNDADQIIGHFGLGFYSAFMVANSVDINSLSYKKDAEAIKWTCDGGTEFSMDAGNKATRGTEIILHLGEEGEDFTKAYKIRETLNKYCSFMPYPIYFKDLSEEPKKDEDGNIIVEEPKALNETSPLYTKQPNSCSDDDYKEFYRQTFLDYKEPLFWIHLNMDYPFRLKGILYFPKLNTEFDTLEGQIKLYNSQVFIAENIKEVIPEFLLLLKGVIDCPDLPLNVSRSFLQNDGFVKKISDYITKKVADKINSLQKINRESYEKYWDDIHPFIKFGALKDDKFFDRVKNSILLKSTSGLYSTIEEQTNDVNKDNEKTLYYTTDTHQQSQYIRMLKEHKIDVIILDHSIDNPFISMLEQKIEGIHFKRVDSDISDLLENKEDTKETTNSEGIQKYYRDLLKSDSLSVELQSLKSKDVSGIIILSEENRRMQDMMRQFSLNGMDPSLLPNNSNLILNQNNDLVQYMLNHIDVEKIEVPVEKTTDDNSTDAKDESKDDNATTEMKTELKISVTNEETVNMIARQIYDLARMSHAPLEPTAMTEFINRSQKILTSILN